MSEILFDRRALSAAIQSPDLNVRRRFLIDNFWPSGITETYSDKVDFMVFEGENGLAYFRYIEAEGKTVRKKDDTLKSIDMPYVRERVQAIAKELQKNFTLNGIYSQSAQNVQQAQRRAVNRYLTMLKNRVMRREEWMAAKLLTAGGFIYDDGETHVEVDLNLPVELLPALAGTSRWNDSAPDIPGDFIDWADLIDQHSGVGAGFAVFGREAAKSFRKDPDIRAELDNRSIQAGTLELDLRKSTARFMGRYNEVECYAYNHQYVDHDGSTGKMIPDNMMVMLSADIVMDTERFFGLVPEADMAFSGEIFSKSWIEEDPSGRWIHSSLTSVADAEACWELGGSDGTIKFIE